MSDDSSRLVVTGAGGFIGGHVVAEALKGGISVTAYARRSASDLETHLAAPVVTADLVADDYELPKGGFLVHCATANDVVSRDFDAGVLLSTVGTRRVLEAAVRAEISHVVVLSTFQVYGTNATGTISTSSELKLESSYSLNHYFAEEIGRYFSSQRGLGITVVRPSNVVGLPPHPLADRSHLVPHCFVKEALASGKVVLNTSGQQMRNFLLVEDFASLLVALQYSVGGRFRVTNVGGGANFAIADVARMVAEVYRDLYGDELEVRLGALRPGEKNSFDIRNPEIETRQEFSKARMKDLIIELFELETGTNV